MKNLKLVSAVALLSLLSACSHGAAAEKDTPIAEIQAKAAAADTSELESTVADYKATLEDWKQDVEKKLDEAKQTLAKTSPADLLGEGGKQAKELADKFVSEADGLKQDIKALQERLAVYAGELEKRIKGS